MVRLSPANIAIITIIAALGLIALRAVAHTAVGNVPVVGPAARFLASAA